MVIARYAESLSWLQSLDAAFLQNRDEIFTTIYVYNKGPDTEFRVPIDVTKYDNVRVEYVTLPNVGRCDHTYLYHIYEHYDALPDTIMFFTGSADIIWKLYKTNMSLFKVYIERNFDTFFIVYHIIYEDKYLQDEFKGFEITEYLCNGMDNAILNPDKTCQPCEIRPFEKWYDHVFGDLKVKQFCYKGIFNVSAKHVRNRPREFYADLMKYVDHHHNPEAAHYIERSWIAIFHPVEEKCMMLE